MASSSTFFFVFSEISGWSFKARDTVEILISSICDILFRVVLCFIYILWLLGEKIFPQQSVSANISANVCNQISVFEKLSMGLKCKFGYRFIFSERLQMVI